MSESTSIQDLLFNFERTGITVEHFLLTLLTTSEYRFHPLAQSLKNNVKDILDIFQTTETTSEAVASWASTMANDVYQSQMETLTNKESGLHFSAKSMTERKLTTFNMCYDFRQLRQLLTVIVSKVRSQMSLEECKSWTCIVLLGLRAKVQVKRLSIKD